MRDGDTLGALVRRLRKNRGMKPGELADAAGISAEYVGSIERDRKSPSIEVLWGIARGLAADAHATAELFDRAGYGDFWTAVGDATAAQRSGVPSIDAFVDNSPELRTPESKVNAKGVLKALSEKSFADEARAQQRDRERRAGEEDA